MSKKCGPDLAYVSNPTHCSFRENHQNASKKSDPSLANATGVSYPDQITSEDPIPVQNPISVLDQIERADDRVTTGSNWELPRTSKR